MNAAPLDRPVCLADVATAVRTALGKGWSVHPHLNGGFKGTIRSYQGHDIEVHGEAAGWFAVTAHLPGGQGVTRTVTVQNGTIADYARALTNVITDALIPAHDVVCPVQQALTMLGAALGDRPASTWWANGAAVAGWGYQGNARAEAVATAHPNGSTPQLSLTLVDLAPEQAVTVLAAVDSGVPVEGDVPAGEVARRLRAAAPGLECTDSTEEIDGREATVALSAEGLWVDIYDPFDGPTVRIVVRGVRNALAAVAALA